MQNLLSSPILIPVAAIIVGGILGILGIWKKVRESELAHEHDLELRRMEHQLRLKELEVEKARMTAGQPHA